MREGLLAYGRTRADGWREWYESALAPFLEKELGAASSAAAIFLIRAPFRGLFRRKGPVETTAKDVAPPAAAPREAGA